MSVLKKDRISKLMQVKKGKGKYARCIVVRNGVRKEIHLGKWGTEEVETEYRRLCAEIYDDIPPVVEKSQISLAELFLEYLKYADTRLRQPEMHVVKTIMRIVFQFYPELMVDEFTAMPYRAIQEYLVKISPNPPSGRPWSRQYVNRMMNTLRAIFKWGISYDLVSAEVLMKLRSVPGVKEGEYAWLKDTEDREDVPDEAVVQTLPFMPPTVADMVKIQRGASMRPGEVCSLTVGDLDMSGELFHVVKKKHKTARTGVKRFFSFNREETEILRRRCEGKSPDDYVFSPREAMKERWEAKSTARKSPVQPSQRLRAESRAATKYDHLKNSYECHEYQQAIAYAIDRANKAGVRVPHWTPYQLRHAAITDNSIRYGQETAGKIAGHKSIQTTDIYNHSAERLSKNAASERKAWWE